MKQTASRKWKEEQKGHSKRLCRDTLYAAKWNQLISFRKHLPDPTTAACTAITSMKRDAEV